jgi:hypothetical protein
MAVCYASILLEYARVCVRACPCGCARVLFLILAEGALYVLKKKTSAKMVKRAPKPTEQRLRAWEGKRGFKGVFKGNTPNAAAGLGVGGVCV